MSNYGLTPKRMDGTNVIGFERSDGYQLYKEPIEELFALKGTLKQPESVIQFEINFDFEFVSLLLLDAIANIQLIIYLNKNSEIPIHNIQLYGDDPGASWINKQYFPKGCVIQVKLNSNCLLYTSDAADE